MTISGLERDFKPDAKAMEVVQVLGKGHGGSTGIGQRPWR